jgi:hypothetical protein
MIVITDTTPLRYLAVLGELEILPRLFGQVVCPMEVLAECRHASAPEVLRLWATKLPDWLKSEQARPADERVAGLGSGEAAAIMLALERGADLLLIDERKGRACAAALGLPLTGTLALLARAGRMGWLDYRSATDRLLRESNFRASPEVIAAIWDHTRGGESGI